MERLWTSTSPKSGKQMRARIIERTVAACIVSYNCEGMTEDILRFRVSLVHHWEGSQG